MSNFEKFPHDLHSPSGFADTQWSTNNCSEPLNIDIQDLLDFPCNDRGELDLGPSSQWSARATQHGNMTWKGNEDITPSVPPEECSPARGAFPAATQSDITRSIEDFTNTTKTLLTAFGDLTGKVNVLSAQVDDLQRRVAHTSANVESLDKTFTEVLKRERMAMEKYGDISSRFQGIQGIHGARRIQTAQEAQGFHEELEFADAQ